MDSKEEASGKSVGNVASPFDLSQTLPVGSGLSVLCSLSGPPVVKYLTRVVTMVSGSVIQCVSPNNSMNKFLSVLGFVNMHDIG